MSGGERGQREAEAAALESEMAEVCGLLNASTGWLVGLIAKVLAMGSWQGWAVRSPEHWVAWRCGVSPERARRLVAMAARLGELPETRQALDQGELSEDQVGVICRYTSTYNDAEVAGLARHATVTQLRRTLSTCLPHPAPRPQPEPEPEPKAETPQPETPRPTPRPEAPEEARRVSFGYTDEGTWRLSALLPADEGALLERALAEAKESLWRLARAEKDESAPEQVGAGGLKDRISWADALVDMAERSLASPPYSGAQPNRHLVLVHLQAGGPTHEPSAHLHLGPALGPGLRRYVCCDARLRAVMEAGGVAVSVGRSYRSVPDRTRTVIEERDRGCRVPGCWRRRALHIHHVAHWEDGGTTDTSNLLALCQAHHRLHHMGRLGITGDADAPDGIVFTDHRGRRLAPNGLPAPPGGPPAAAAARIGIPTGHWSHPSGERLERKWVSFREPQPVAK
ncbi:MAG: DUF222 domain-containing protein [Candidatus Dormibacteria bacterium]